jgi:hypothetical protein
MLCDEELHTLSPDPAGIKRLKIGVGQYPRVDWLQLLPN